MSVYNGMPYLKEAVQSILEQTYKDFEFIIIDDASQDDSWQYLKSLKDKRIRLIKNKKNSGLATSLNVGLKIARGDYIARMDADDISLKQRFEKQLRYLEKNPSIDLCGTWAMLINNNGEVIKSVHKPIKDKEIKKTNFLLTSIIHPTWFGKRKMFENLGGYDQTYDMVEDYEFLMRAKQFKMANIGEELLMWRSPESRRSNKSIEKIYRKSLSVKWKYFLQGDLTHLPYLFRALVSTYLFPTKLKIFLNKKAGLIA